MNDGLQLSAAQEHAGLIRGAPLRRDRRMGTGRIRLGVERVDARRV